MIREEYHISRSAMENLVSQLRKPSRVEVSAREEMMRSLRASMSMVATETGKSVTYDDLDLSFLDDPDPLNDSVSMEQGRVSFSFSISGRRLNGASEFNPTKSDSDAA